MEILKGTTGSDTLNVSTAGFAYEIQGLAGNDTITGSAFADQIVGGPGADTMSGGAGDDTFLITGTDSAIDTVSGGDGFDQIVGEAGDDTFRFYSYSGTNTVERIDGGGGLNVIAGSATSGSTLNLSGTVLLNIARIVGGSGWDTITGSAGNDVIEGGLGKDSMSGGSGDDTFIITGSDAASAFDTVSGGDGVDQILGGTGDDTFRFHNFSGANTVERIDGGAGLNIIAAVAASGSILDLSSTVLLNISQIVGGMNVDKLTGSAGDDRISGGGGNDILVGGGGNDTARYSGNFVDYTITALAGAQWRVATTTATDGSDTLSSFELLDFANGTYSIATGVFTPSGPLNNAPAAAADLYNGTEDQALTVNAAAGVLANDSDADGNPLNVSTFSALSARGGTVAVNSNGSFTYTPVANINGTDTYSYTVSDGNGGSATATVTVNLAPVADAPLAVNNAYNTTKDNPLTIAPAASVLANDSDPDGDGLTVSAFSATSAQGGTVAMNADGTFTYMPPAGFTGIDTFAYTASDGELTSSASVSITVASALALRIGTTGNDTLNMSSAGVAYEIQGLAGNDTITGSAFGDLIAGGPGADTMSGGAGDDTVLITGTDSATDTVSGGDGFDQVVGEAGDDTFRFLNYSGTNTVERIDGGGGLNVIAGSATSGSTLNLSGTALLNIARIVGGSAMDTITGSAGNDVIDGGLGKDTMSGGDGDDTFVMTGIDTGPVYDSVMGGRDYDQVLGGAGDDTFRFHSYINANTVERIDGGAGLNTIAAVAGSGSVINLSGTVLLNIAEIVGGLGGDKLTGSAGDDRISGDAGNDTLDGGARNDRIRGGAGNDILIGGTGNDTALYGGNFSAYTITALANAQWRVATTTNTDGSDTLSSFEFLEFANGTYSIATGVFTPFSASSNHAPLAVADLYNATEDQALTITAAAGALANDSDADGNPLSVSAFSAVSDRGGTVTMTADGSFAYMAAANVNGIDSFYYTASDGNGGNATVTVTLNIAPVADAPHAVNNLYNATKDTALTVNLARTGVLANDSDHDGDVLTVSAFDSTSAQGGTVAMNADGSFTYTPAAGFTGIDTFAYTASDGALVSSATVSVDVGLHAPMSAFQSMIANLGEGEWAKLNANQFNEVWAPAAQRPTEWIAGSPASIILAWGAATWDVNREEYIIWGGGHANYGGNEVYTWNAGSLLWERASLPSAIHNISGSRYETVDGYLNAPIASHAYDSMEFLEVADRMITFGGAAAHTGSYFVQTDGVTRTGPYLWDPSKADPNAVGGLAGSQVNPAQFPNVAGGEMWENRNTWSSMPTGTSPDQTSDYVKVDGKDVVYLTGQYGLFTYTIADVNRPELDVWEKVGKVQDAFNGTGAGAYDPDDNLYLRTSATSFTYWDLDFSSPGNPVGNVTFMPEDPTGEFTLTKNFGMEYDPVRQEFVLWEGDSTIWLLRPPEELGAAGWTITKAPAGDQLAPSVPAAFTGVVGKWDYVAKDDIFIGLTDSQTGDIWAYKPDDWTPQTDWIL